MARGKKSLLETSDLPIVTTDKEEGQIPYFIIDDEWGISCDNRNEILVKKRVANRTIKDQETESSHIEQYFMWDSVCYHGNFTQAIESYYERKEKGVKSRLKARVEFKELIGIQKEIKETISKCLQKDGLNKEFLSITSILDERAKIKEQLELLKEEKDELENEFQSFKQLIKEKRSIIIKDTTPKKHRVKKENGDL